MPDGSNQMRPSAISMWEKTLVGVNPALDRFTDLARQLREEAEEQARRHGRELGTAVAMTPPKAA
jgi:hypothetical protein